ncbi:hypothetical protein B1B07_03875 [Kocuria marina subsp. indica]|nr:hypothetical protein B1B07_03875 [Kocuria indica]
MPVRSPGTPGGTPRVVPPDSAPSPRPGTDPAALDTSHPHVVVCSTYGGGELPTSARAFATAVAEGAADLSSVRYAAFGLGNRTYGQTFARRRRAGRDPRGSGRVPVRGRGSA